MKKKITQFRWLVTMLLLVTAIAMPSVAWAQNQMYTELSSGTLTFKYGEKPTGGEGITVYDIPDDSSQPNWKSYASSITTVVFDDSFKDARPTTCYKWFRYCTSLTAINGIENLNTAEVTDMNNMFRNCSSLTTLDLSGFNTAKVEDMNYMFCNCSKLTTIYVSDNFTTSAVTSSEGMFSDCTSLAGAIKYDPSKTDANYANTNGYFSIKGSETNPKGAYVVYTDADKTLTFKYGEIPTGGEGITVYDIPDNSSTPVWKEQASSITTVVFDESFKDARPTRCYGWFKDCTSLTSINGIENLNTEEVTNMRYMFHNCSSLTTLDLSGFNTAKVEYMGMMFCNCSKLTTIYVSDDFTTSAVKQSDDMFTGCTSLAGAIKYDSSKTDANYANYANYHTGYFSYGINTADDLKTFANKVNGTYTPAEGETATPYTAICAGLLKDITDANVLTTIGSNGFTGTFDGCGHTISGLNFNSTFSALFAQNGGTIKNLGVLNATIEGASGNICQTNSGTIESCYFMGTTGSQSAGGICPTNNGTMTKCYYLADVDNGNGGKTEEQFNSGEVCYLLSQGAESSVWGQQLGTDNYPVLCDYKVIKAAKGDNNTYWATFSNQNADATLSVPSPRNLNVYNATVSNGTMTLTKRTDNQVAKEEGVLLKTDGEYVNAKANETDGLNKVEYANNNLVATPDTEGTITADAGYTLYRLTYNKVSTKEGLGFYLGLVKDANDNVTSSNGSELKATPGKAYLKVSTGAATNSANAALARGFAFPGDDDTTGIGEIVIEGDAGISGSANANDRIYNLQGQQVTAPVKGLYIKNNKKVIIK